MKKISVRDLVEFILKKGSINTKDTSSSTHTAQEGSRIHRVLQKKLKDQYKDDYQSEVVFRFIYQSKVGPLQIEGRADGLITSLEYPMIDEIKTSETPFEEINENKLELYWSQVKLYGYFYLVQEEMKEIDLQLTYFQTTTNELTQSQQHFTLDELSCFYLYIIEEYEKWLVFQANWQQTRNQSIQALKFPFDSFRKGQRELSKAVFSSLKEQKKLYIEAPTGTGKTLSTLFPAIKLLGELNEEEAYERIFYLTAKTITRTVAQDSMEMMGETGLQMKSVTLTAKDKICFMEETKCIPEYCPFANGYYERKNGALLDLLENKNLLNRQVIENYGQKHQVCPFELSLEASLWSDVIIGDYNYLFDPRVALERFFASDKTKSVFLIDEAHNLIDRTRSMYTKEISLSNLKFLQKQLKKEKKIAKQLTKIREVFTTIDAYLKNQKIDFHAQSAQTDSILQPMYTFIQLMKEWLPQNQEHERFDEILLIFFEFNAYLKISEYFDDHFVLTAQKSNNELILTQKCLDPRFILETILAKGMGSVLFSASFTPLGYYQEMLGGTLEDYQYQTPSPFEQKNQKIVIDSSISTVYRNREKSIPKIVEKLKTLIETKPGNYLFFFPSYKYLDDVLVEFDGLVDNVSIHVQENKMDEVAREEFLAHFTNENQGTTIGFCVLGGIFSEGIDLKGTSLIGVAIVSIGLPQINEEVELLKNYYDETNGKGFLFAYQIPGMNKVIQAAGRVIRTNEDKGVVLLLDERFARVDVQQLFPAHWFPHEVIYSTQQLAQSLEKFW
ncbi:MAG: ATP-dependent DNA helicase, partial [Streptococcaceae bacterium]|nr:ATP-dependent DNA helicase [Streptococcaceae bacterium]